LADTVRAFVAVGLPEPVRTLLQTLQERLGRGALPVRWVPPENVHLTLKFLGEIPEADVSRVSDVLAAAARGSGPISLTARGLGVFPAPRRPKVIWVGVGGNTGTLADLQRRLDTGLVSAGIPAERRAFHAHLTLGRVKGRLDGSRLGRSMDRLCNFDPVPFCADRVVLFQSILKPSGAEYSELFSTGYVMRSF
jgi:RNA 2',3'-cyclic 3'-phosphodiesterase